MELPEKFYIDPGYKELAVKRYSEDELKEIGCEMADTGHYILFSSNELRGVDLVFEKHSDGKWGVTTENRRVLFDLPTPQNLVKVVLEEIDNGKIRNLDDVKKKLESI